MSIEINNSQAFFSGLASYCSATCIFFFLPSVLRETYTAPEGCSLEGFGQYGKTASSANDTKNNRMGHLITCFLCHLIVHGK